MALTKEQVEALVYKRKDTNDIRTFVPATEAEQLTIRNTVEALLSQIVVKHSS